VDGATLGIIGGIGGALLGLIGGGIGTYVSIKNAQGPRERSFLVSVSVMAWVALVAFLATLFLIPAPFRFFLWLPWIGLLIWGVRVWKQRHAHIRAEEAAERDPAEPDATR
jgi:Na+-transporting NADH:ubiquinone oxidoreductase subunit NqrD